MIGAAPTHDHVFRLEGLSADTMYHYQVTHGGDPPSERKRALRWASSRRTW
jgi:hypothetical protein